MPASDRDRVAVVTDSTASLPARVVAEHAIVVVPLQVVIGAQVYDEVLEEDPSGESGGATPAMVAEALRTFRPVSTSRPTPSALLEVYERAAADGASEIVSIHLSGEMSGTFESAQLAAKESSVPVHAVDSRQVGVATGYAALSAAEVVAAGGSALEAVEAARERAT
jgi:DegV family protein with EDD domain